MYLATYVSLLLVLFSGLQILILAVPKLDHSNFMPFAFDFDEDQSRTTWRGERERLEWLLQLECKDPEHWKKEAVKLLWEEGENQAVSLLWHMMG